MREIKASKGETILVDDEDYADLVKHTWRMKNGYAMRTIWHPEHGRSRADVRMHRQIMGLAHGDKQFVDHINGNRLDNRRENLRFCTCSQNGCNRGPTKANKSGYKGVRWNKSARKWVAVITIRGRTKTLGCYDDPKDAFSAYFSAAVIFHREFANFGEMRNET